ncbi:MAG: Type 1 glutamine amidotransferase-like domain-containing protein, partial [Bacteroidales bacterium]|nr:Type 1 glutamine amidotransferase-like domain-containing protein [Bacteroidales bacterium]
PHPEIDKMIKHGGETRQDRLNEYLAVRPEMTVVGLREACALWLTGKQLYLRGGKPMVVFHYDQEKGIQAEEFQPNQEVSFLMK